MLRRFAPLVLIAVLAAAPAPASAARIGADLDAFVSGLIVCVTEPYCATLQTKLTDARTRAPFSGIITQYRIKQPIGTFSLQVLRRKGGGSFKSVRSSGAVGPISSGPNEVVGFLTILRVRKGDFVAIRSEDFGSSSFAFDDATDDGIRGKLFQPGIGDGEKASPTSSSPPGRTFLYNATVKRF
jgi:hypothetical protein